MSLFSKATQKASQVHYSHYIKTAMSDEESTDKPEEAKPSDEPKSS
jgi:hypothetical protein